MIEVQIERQELDRLIKRLSESPDVIQEAKREAFEAASAKMKEEVDRGIGGTGKVKSWQEQYVGSLGGYAAVRPKAKTFTEVNGQGKEYAVGYVTNAINSGHRFPTPSGRDPRYEPRIKSGRMNVPGKKFYQEAEKKLPQIAQEAVDQVAETLINHLEG